MKKVMIAVLSILLLSIAIGIGWKPVSKQKELHLDTLMFLGDSNDTMYFVVDENGDTVDWFMYWGDKKLDKHELDYLYHLPDSFKE